jgi:hypothetical protein
MRPIFGVLVFGFLVLAVMTCCGAKKDLGDGSTVPPPSSEKAYVRIGPAEGLEKFKDVSVVLEGRLSQVPWQHMIRRPGGYRETAYFDYGAGRQTVLYTKNAVFCDGGLTVWGKVVEVRGESKRPGSDAPAAEFQILVDRWECAK